MEKNSLLGRFWGILYGLITGIILSVREILAKLNVISLLERAAVSHEAMEAFFFVMRWGLFISAYEVRRSFPVFHQDSKRGMRNFHFTASESPTGELI